MTIRCMYPSCVCLCAVTDMEGFNSHLNMEQMNKALISLNDMYAKAAEKGEHCPNGSLAFCPVCKEYVVVHAFLVMQCRI